MLGRLAVELARGAGQVERAGASREGWWQDWRAGRWPGTREETEGPGNTWTLEYLNVIVVRTGLTTIMTTAKELDTKRS